MVITNAQLNDAGLYICICHTADGKQSQSEYDLSVEVPPPRNEVKPPQIEHAEAGKNVVLNCNPERYANRYHWSRQQGHFAPGQDISSVCISVVLQIFYWKPLVKIYLILIYRAIYVWKMFKLKMLAFTFAQLAMVHKTLK